MHKTPNGSDQGGRVASEGPGWGVDTPKSAVGILNAKEGQNEMSDESRLSPVEREQRADGMTFVRAAKQAIEAWEALENAVANCDEHEPEMAPETCEMCFPLADDARLKLRAAALLIASPPKDTPNFIVCPTCGGEGDGCGDPYHTEGLEESGSPEADVQCNGTGWIVIRRKGVPRG